MLGAAVMRDRQTEEITESRPLALSGCRARFADWLFIACPPTTTRPLYGLGLAHAPAGLTWRSCARQVIARLARLSALNGAAVSAAERRDAELHYLRRAEGAPAPSRAHACGVMAAVVLLREGGPCEDLVLSETRRAWEAGPIT
jgi:hypothetical protein